MEPPADQVVDEVALEPHLGLETHLIARHLDRGDGGRVLQSDALHLVEFVPLGDGADVAQAAVADDDGHGEHGRHALFDQMQQPAGKAGQPVELGPHRGPVEQTVQLALGPGEVGRDAQRFERDVEHEHRLVDETGGRRGHLAPAAARDDHLEQVAVDLLRLLEQRGLPVDQDLHDLLHDAGPADLLRHLDDGEVALLGDLEDVEGERAHEPLGLDEQGRRPRRHDAAAEVALPVGVVGEREHGRGDDLAARQPVGDVGHLTHGERGHGAVQAGGAGEHARLRERPQLEYLFDGDRQLASDRAQIRPVSRTAFARDYTVGCTNGTIHMATDSAGRYDSDRYGKVARRVPSPAPESGAPTAGSPARAAGRGSTAHRTPRATGETRRRQGRSSGRRGHGLVERKSTPARHRSTQRVTDTRLRPRSPAG